ncbi:MAG: secreted effector protein PipB2, partial [Pseudomonadota bacterium]
SEARLEGADLSGARLEGADLSWARLEGAVLAGARLEGADLWQARLEGAVLAGARLEGAVLSWARLEGADLSGARLDDRTLLTDATLRGASVRSVDWQNVSLSPDQILSMFGDGSVILPGGVKPGEQGWPEHWPERELGWGEFEEEWRKWQADPEGYEPPPVPVEAEEGE